MTLEEAVRGNPKRKLAVRQRIFSGLFGFLVALLYLTLICVMFKLQFHHWSAYDRPTATSQILDLCFDVILLPFGAIPFLDQFAVLLDMIFWGVIGGFIYARFCSKRVAA
jgi:hypothetical protein